MCFKLFIDLQEGFLNDGVLVKINGKTIFKKDRISTSLLSGPAASFEVSVGDSVSVEILIPTRNLRESIKLDVEAETYLGISIVEPDISPSRIRIIISQVPFGYL